MNTSHILVLSQLILAYQKMPWIFDDGRHWIVFVLPKNTVSSPIVIYFLCDIFQKLGAHFCPHSLHTPKWSYLTEGTELLWCPVWVFLCDTSPNAPAGWELWGLFPHDPSVWACEYSRHEHSDTSQESKRGFASMEVKIRMKHIKMLAISLLHFNICRFSDVNWDTSSHKDLVLAWPISFPARSQFTICKTIFMHLFTEFRACKGVYVYGKPIKYVLELSTWCKPNEFLCILVSLSSVFLSPTQRF